MNIRAYADSDLSHLIDLTIATFGPFYEAGFRPLVGEAVFENQHGQWRGDYRTQVPTLHDPADHKLVAVAVDEDRILGYVGWNYDLEHQNGGLYASLGCTPYPVTVYYRRL